MKRNDNIDLVQPNRKPGARPNILYKLFNPYPNSSVISQNDLSILADKYSNFYDNYIDENLRRDFKKKQVNFDELHQDTFNKLSEIGNIRKKFFRFIIKE